MLASAGDRVKARGFAARFDLNNKMVVLREWCSRTQRWLATVEDTGESVSIRPDVIVDEMRERRQREERERADRDRLERHERERREQEDRERVRREQETERKLKVRRIVADEIAALSATSEHMGDALAPLSLSDLPPEVLASVLSQLMSHLKRPRSSQPSELVKQFKELVVFTSSCGGVRRAALQLLDGVQKDWKDSLAKLSQVLSGRSDVSACANAQAAARVFLEHRPEAAPWLDPRLLETWADLPAHFQVGALAVHMTRVGKRLDEVLIHGTECSPFVQRVLSWQMPGSSGPLGAHLIHPRQEVMRGLGRFTTALVAGNWYDAWYHDHEPPWDDEDNEDNEDDNGPEAWFSYDFQGYPAGVFVLSSPPMAALLLDGWVAFMENVQVIDPSVAFDVGIERMVQYIVQEIVALQHRS
tara:strand:- start:928 stop:2178 length:1251 start_codon:yes stop_codon:yes gene_type:complete